MANSSDWRREKLLIYSAYHYILVGRRGHAGWPWHRSPNSHCFSNLPPSPFLSLSLSHTHTNTQTHKHRHTHTASPINLYFKRLLYCGSYWFLCFRCRAQRDLRAKEAVVFLSKLPRFVCQSARSTQSVPGRGFCWRHTHTHIHNSAPSVSPQSNRNPLWKDIFSFLLFKI